MGPISDVLLLVGWGTWKGGLLADNDKQMKRKTCKIILALDLKFINFSGFLRTENFSIQYSELKAVTKSRRGGSVKGPTLIQYGPHKAGPHI